MDLYLHSTKIQTRWSSFENPTAGKGTAGKINRGWKGAPSSPLLAGQSVTLLNVQESGIIRRIWMTLSDRSPEILRGLRIDCYWDATPTPAVSAPLGDFFGIALGQWATFESDLFCSAEGRSFCSLVPMPFRKAARIIITNETSKDISALFYDVNLTLEPLPESALYFHAAYRRERPCPLGKDFEILPRIEGRGRYLGTNIGVMADPIYGDAWWGEGEVKCYLDGDIEYPTLCGTGTEDYISTAYGQGAFSQRYHGAPIADVPNKQWAFYRFHIPDPVIFQTDCRVTIQQIGGATRSVFLSLQAAGAKLVPISMYTGLNCELLLDGPSPRRVADASDAEWVNFQRSDDFSATAYFYLDRAENGLPPLASLAERTAALVLPKADEPK